MKIDTNLVENLIERYLPFGREEVYEAMRYSLFSGGKRLRPILLLQIAQQLGVLDDNTQRLAVALEMIHTYSLVHDDLPCMDDDDFRRGKPSCHKQFGEAQAVLAGDTLLNCAIEVALGGECNTSYLLSVRHLFACSGYRGMITGQSLDLFTKPTNLEDLCEIASGKTSALFSASIVCPALYAGLADNQIELLKKIANALGIVFQIVDDIQDAEEKSFVAVLGKQESIEVANRLLENVYKMTKLLDFDAKILVDFAKTLQNCL